MRSILPASARDRSPQNGTVCLPVVGSCDTGAVTADPVAPLRALLTEAGFAGSAHWWIEPQSASGSPSRPFEIEPYEYLQWAEQALEERTTAGDVHAILDAKRAIDSVADRLLDIAGIDRSGLSRRKRMEAIARMHVAAPRIIQKLTETRNTLEHDYRRPSHDEAETAVDVATLFFAASRHLEVLFPNEFALRHDDADVGIQFCGWREEPGFAYWRLGERPSDPVPTIGPADAALPFVVGLAVSSHLEHREEEAVLAFRSHIRL